MIFIVTMLADLVPKSMDSVFSIFDKVNVPFSVFGDFSDGKSKS